MKNLKVILLTALVTLPVGIALAGPLAGHPNLEHARNSLNEADDYIARSQKANERVWGDEGGHGQKAKELIHQAKGELDLAAEWVNHHPK